ncbi:uncharacterized protein LOC133190053 [Saccostrea echinata]|uniref:uncharacterized protein LOC133190053 n=1 Tax=Saccostrea echinata TaxID=191078 RepID=UPI002A7EB086|nr:uncharacterized protein LOC133190053 [Saccostrea echinata]XP_061181508.1 uncharacterized protein LOC133190053 [Saccostrea echinata]
MRFPCKGCSFLDYLLNISVLVKMLAFTCHLSKTDANACTGTCEDKFFDMQRGCNDYETKMTKYDNFKQSTELCRSLVDFLLCVGNVAPMCLDKMMELKSPLFQSPYDCHITDEDLTKIQRYKSCKHLTTSTAANSIDPSTVASQSYEPNTKSFSVTFQTSSPTNQHQKESNSSKKLYVNLQTLVIAWLLYFGVVDRTIR